MSKMYFKSIDDEDVCQSKQYLLDFMREKQLTELKVYEAEIERNARFFFCTDAYEVGEKSEGGCGKMCKNYKPRNGKSGCCKNNRGLYTAGKEVILKLK